MTYLQRLLATLDACLTGKDWATVTSSYSFVRATVETMLEGREYYLSDGGYSRVCVNVLADPPRLFLTSNSRDDVKARWTGCKELVKDIDAEILRLAKENGWAD